jgi:serine/threonine protein kinase
MGVVYKAFDPQLKRFVAIKVMSAAGHADQQELERFRLEAEAIARLRHPNIVQVYEVGEHGGHPYIALEFVDGPTLAGFVQGEPQASRFAAELVATLAWAIHHAHGQGIAHRDLKPANILLGGRVQRGDAGSSIISETESPEWCEPTIELASESTPLLCAGSWSEAGNRPALDSTMNGPQAGRSGISTTGHDDGLGGLIPKITDFGLAKELDSYSDLTCSGAIVGTPQYMAPEQAAGSSRHVGPPADVYSLGAILYYLVTGREPFHGSSALETLMMVRNENPTAPTLLVPQLSKDVETICLKCLEKDPAKRYASAADLAEELERFIRGEPILARPVGRVERAWRWCRRNPVVSVLAITCALMFAIGFAGVAWKWREAANNLPRLGTLCCGEGRRGGPLVRRKPATSAE